MLGESPVSEFEVNNNDEYIAALNKQLAEIKILKAQEEKEIQQAIPEWYTKVPASTEKVMYAIGTHQSDTLNGARRMSQSRALEELSRKIETRLSSKENEMVDEAALGSNSATKTEISFIAQRVVKDVTVSGWEIVETKIVDTGPFPLSIFDSITTPVALSEIEAFKSNISD